jgi:hypothetical protein
MALGEQLLPGTAMDGAVDAASPEEARVGRVDDRVDLQRGDVGFDDRDSSGSVHRASAPMSKPRQELRPGAGIPQGGGKRHRRHDSIGTIYEWTDIAPQNDGA